MHGQLITLLAPKGLGFQFFHATSAVRELYSTFLESRVGAAVDCFRRGLLQFTHLKELESWVLHT